MRIDRLTVCGVIVCGLAVAALAERATAVLDDVETALQTAAADLAGNTTKAGKKQLKAADKGLKFIGKDSASELGDVKLLKKVAGATLKRFADDVDVVQPIVAAADAFDASIDADLDAARARVPAETAAKKVKPAQVTKAIARAQKLLDKSRAKDTKPRIAVLFKARKAADKAVALAERLEPVDDFTPPPGATFTVEPGGSGGLEVIAYDWPTGVRSVIDTGTGEIQLDDPKPVGTVTGSAFALQQGTRMVVVAVDSGIVVSGSAIDSDWGLADWSPDGTTLVAAGQGPDKLLLMDRAGATIWSFDERVYRGFPIEQTFLWSPDGAFVAYRTDRNTDGVKELQVLELSSGTITEVTTRGLGTDQYRYVAWAGQSNRLVFPENSDRQTSETELVVVNADGTGHTIISQAGQDVRDSGSNVNVLQTNPSGDGVLYEFRRNGMGFIGTVHLDGSSSEVIATASANFINEHAWSPDGTRIAYIDDGSLYSCNPDGSDTNLVTPTCPDFRWAPDGSALVYRDGNGSFATELFLALPDGTEPLRVSPDLAGAGNVESPYLVAPADGGVVIVFVADGVESNRTDVHTVIAPVGGPAKDLTAEFRDVIEGKERFRSSAYTLKGVRREDSVEDTPFGPMNTSMTYSSLECDDEKAYIRSYLLQMIAPGVYTVRRVSEQSIALDANGGVPFAFAFGFSN